MCAYLFSSAIVFQIHESVIDSLPAINSDVRMFNKFAPKQICYYPKINKIEWQPLN